MEGIRQVFRRQITVAEKVGSVHDGESPDFRTSLLFPTFRGGLKLTVCNSRNRIILMTSMTNEERMQRESNLIATIRKALPDFARMCADGSELVMLHQDAFAADYQEDEYTLLGMAIKYAGLRGKEVRVIGENRSI